MKRQRQRSGMSPMWRRKPAKVSQRKRCTPVGRRRLKRWTSAPCSSATAALSIAEAPAPSTATTLPLSRVEVDVQLAGMGAAIGRQVAHEVGHPPFAGAVLAGGQHQLACRQNLAGGERHQQARPAIVQPAGRDGGGGDVVAHRQAEHAAVPHQILVPVDARDQVHVGEGLRAVLRLVPRLEGQARDAEVRSGLQLGAAQRRHAGEGDPGAFLALAARDRSPGCCARARASGRRP